MNLRYSILSAHDAGEKRHAQAYMRARGIRYVDCECITFVDCWVFFGCTNVPTVLPPWLSVTDYQGCETEVSTTKERPAPRYEPEPDWREE